MRSITHIFLILSLAAVGCGKSSTAEAPVLITRNDVPNEGHYFKKAFLIAGPDGAAKDTGWLLKATVLEASSPNPLAGLGLFAGAENGGAFGRFVVSERGLDFVDQRQLSADPALPASLAQWPVESVDLVHQLEIELNAQVDVYSENRERDWQDRAWVKVAFDKHDLSDLGSFGVEAREVLRRCTAGVPLSAAAVVPGSMRVDETQGAFSFQVALSVALRFDDPACVEGFARAGALFQSLGRTAVTFKVMYSFVRAEEAPSYAPLSVGPSDPIRRKYGLEESVAWSYDGTTGAVSPRPRALRFDPQKAIVFYFAPSVTDADKQLFTATGALRDQTNAIFAAAGVPARISFADAQAQQLGDVRYNFIRRQPDADADEPVAFTQLAADPRTGQVLSATVTLPNSSLEHSARSRLDLWFDALGIEPTTDGSGNWPAGASGCLDGDAMEIYPGASASLYASRSSLYTGLQNKLGRPVSTHGYLSPSDLAGAPRAEYRAALSALVPHEIYADPALVSAETSVLTALENGARYEATLARLEHGEAPFNPTSSVDALRWSDSLRELSTASAALNTATRSSPGFERAGVDGWLETLKRDGRRCVNGTWETRAQYLAALQRSFRARSVAHAWGHALGLTDNLIGSTDAAHFATYLDGQSRSHTALYSSSVMDHGLAFDRWAWSTATGAGFAPYDRAALAFLYANTTQGSGWKDPQGVQSSVEIDYRTCDARHERYSPFCRRDDFGSTPSEIVAAAIEQREWQWRWNNFALPSGLPGETPSAGLTADLLRFNDVWRYDWSTSALAASLPSVGISASPQLSADFTAEASLAGQLATGYFATVLQLSDRSYRSSYDAATGQLLSQGIFTDKLLALEALTTLRSAAYDPSRTAGVAVPAFDAPFADVAYAAAASNAVFVAVEGNYAAFAWARPLAVFELGRTVRDPSLADAPARAWLSGHAFTSELDFVFFFAGVAVSAGACPSVLNCSYDPRTPRSNPDDIAQSDALHEFISPDGHRWVWASLPSRGSLIAVDREVAPASYLLVHRYIEALQNPSLDLGPRQSMLEIWLDALPSR